MPPGAIASPTRQPHTSSSSRPPVRGCGSEGEASRRPLYLCARLKATVQADGPALCVRSVRQSDSRYPLCRISRVIANTRVDWTATALQACFESGIPIVIVAGNGAPLGCMQPARAGASRASGALDEVLDRPDWPEIYGNWLRATRMRVIADWRREREGTGRPLHPGEFRELVRRHVYGPADADPFDDTAGLWRAALYAMAASALSRAGMRSAYWGAGGGALRLQEDLARVLELMLRLEVHAGMEGNVKGEALMLRVFHAISGKLEARSGQVILSLARRVNQVLGEWR